jgi:hypothetical protein
MREQPCRFRGFTIQTNATQRVSDLWNRASIFLRALGGVDLDQTPDYSREIAIDSARNAALQRGAHAANDRHIRNPATNAFRGNSQMAACGGRLNRLPELARGSIAPRSAEERVTGTKHSEIW